MSQYTFECTVCNYRADTFGDLVNHPCQQRQMAEQQRREQAMKKVNLDDYLFCPVCGSGRLKANEEKRRRHPHIANSCLLCRINDEDDWSFLNQFSYIPRDHAVFLRCPWPGCEGEAAIARDDFWAELEWEWTRSRSGAKPRPFPRLRRKRLDRPCPSCRRPLQSHLLLTFPENRLRLLTEITFWLRSFESEQLRQLRYHAPDDPRVSDEAMREQERIWQQREERLEHERHVFAHKKR